jgi:type VI secretion system secreted protein VgrG
MPSAKSGTACNLVSPAAPRSATDADDAVAGDVDKGPAAGNHSGSKTSGSTPIKRFKPADSDADASDTDDPTTPPKTGWIEIVMVGEDGNPISGEPYSITLPDGTVADGTLDEKGLARVEGFVPGSCQITFPNLDQEAWE